MYEGNVIHDKEGKKSIFTATKSSGMSNYSRFDVWCYSLQLSSFHRIKKENIHTYTQKKFIVAL